MLRNQLKDCLLEISRLRTAIEGVMNDVKDLAQTVATNPVFQQQVLRIALPVGAIVAFDATTGCPNGWSPFERAGGRTLIGAGLHTNLDQSGHALSTYKVGDIGGEERHTLTLEEMPGHTHQLYKTDNGRGQGLYPDNHVMGESPRIEIPSSAAGGGKAHNTMPPFIALAYCVKNDS
jgi:hypothetical protein